MNLYIGTKLINAKPMNRLDYNIFRGWDLPTNEDGTDEGYLVEYLDGGEANTSEYKGYVSWSPKAVFEKAYNPMDELTFGDALVLLKAGYKVARVGWNGKGMWLRMVKTGNYDVACGIVYPKGTYEEGQDVVTLAPWIGMKAAGSTFVPWLASQTDMLAEDWTVVD